MNQEKRYQLESIRQALINNGLQKITVSSTGIFCKEVFSSRFGHCFDQIFWLNGTDSWRTINFASTSGADPKYYELFYAWKLIEKHTGTFEISSLPDRANIKAVETTVYFFFNYRCVPAGGGVPEEAPGIQHFQKKKKKY